MRPSAHSVRLILLSGAFILVLAVCNQTWAVTRVQNQNSATSSALELVREGSYHYLKHDFERAIGPYQKALELEKENRTLDKTIWRVLIDNLGMAYGITGELDKAKDTFKYGISKDPDYPLFYYNMACTYGEMKDMDNAIKYLELAFDRRENIIPGERMPNPATDSSFKRFMNDEKFKAALKGLKQK